MQLHTSAPLLLQMIEQSSLSTSSLYYDYHPPSIIIPLCHCPWGVPLQHNPPYCDCDPQLVRHTRFHVLSINRQFKENLQYVDRILQCITEWKPWPLSSCSKLKVRRIGWGGMSGSGSPSPLPIGILQE